MSMCCDERMFMFLYFLITLSRETLCLVICSVLLVLTHCHMQIPHLRPAEYKRSRLSRNRRTVNRAYGGVLSGGAVRERFVFLEILLI